MPLAYALFAELAAGGIPEQDLVVRMTAGDGSLVDVEVSGRMLRDPGGDASGLIVVTRDISARRRTDADLRESQERFQRVVEASRDLIAILDPAGVVRFLSPAHSKVLGYDDADILGRSVTTIVHPDDALDAVEGVRELTKNLDSAIGEMRLRHANGDWIPFEVAASPLMEDGQLRSVVTVARDLRERRRTEGELRKSEARFRQVLETSQDLISMTDETGIYLFVSPSHEGVLGYAAGELLGRNVAELFHPEELPGLIESFEARQTAPMAQPATALQPAPAVQPATLRFRHKDGSWVPIEVASSQFRDADGAMTTVAVGRDVRPREAAERAIRESEERFAQAFHLSPLASVLTRWEDGIIVDCNERFVELTCWPREELIGRTTADINLWWKRGDRDQVAKMFDADGKVSRFETRLRQRGGEFREITIAVTRLQVGGEAMLFAVFEDVTLRKHAEETVTRLSTILETEHQASLDGILIVDPESNVVSCNERYLDMWRLTPEIVARGFEERSAAVRWLHGDPDAVIAMTRGVYERREPTATGTLELTDGRTLDFHTAMLTGADGTDYGRVWYYRDVTEQRRAEEELRRSEERYRRLVEFSPSAIVVHQGGVVRYLNAPARQLFGVAEGAGPDAKIADFIGNNDIEALSANARANRTAAVPQFAEARLKLPGGGELDVEVASVTTSFGGEPAIQTVIRDVSEQRRANEERLALERKLLEAQKLESLGVLAGGIAHDFNNLLVAIMGNAGLAAMELPPASPLRVYLDEIETASQRAAELTRQMLAYSGKGRFVVAPLDLVAIVEEMSNLLSVSLPKRAALTLALGRGLPTFEGDATQIRQVVMNLVINAGEAIGEREGAIHVSTGVADCTAKYLAGGVHSPELPGGQYVYLEVTDTGCGMDAGDVGPDLRPVLHDEIRRARARPGRRAGDRARTPRLASGDERSRPGDHVPAAAAGARGRDRRRIQRRCGRGIGMAAIGDGARGGRRPGGPKRRGPDVGKARADCIDCERWPGGVGAAGGAARRPQGPARRHDDARDDGAGAKRCGAQPRASLAGRHDERLQRGGSADR